MSDALSQHRRKAFVGCSFPACQVAVVLVRHAFALVRFFVTVSYSS